MQPSATRYPDFALTVPTDSRNSSCRRSRTGCKQGQSVRGLALETALWCRYCLGQDETGKSIAVEDEHADILKAWAQNVFSGATSAKMPDLFGPLGDDPVFLAAFNDATGRLRTLGVAGTLSDYVAPSG